MKNILISLFLGLTACICLGQASSAVQDQNPTAQNIILLIGDGMGLSQVYAAMVANKEPLNIERCRHIGFAKTFSENNFITDSGAGGTAIATGHKTYNGAISVDSLHNPLKTILEYAEEHGKSTGLVATSTITHATPASFIAHQADRNNYEAIAKDFLETDIEVFIGGGLDHFMQRLDSLDLTEDLKEKGYQLVYDIDGLADLKEGKIAALLYPGSPPRYVDGRQDMLPVSTDKAIELLCQDEDGFFLMVEGSQIDWAGHSNDPQYLIDEMLDFDRAVGKALDYAKKQGNTLVIVTADHETGGLGILGGDIIEGTIEAGFTTGNHTGVMVPVFAYGPGAELLQGIYDNTGIFHKMMEAFGFSE